MTLAPEEPPLSFVVNRWRRWGRDRLYIQTLNGEKLGYYDLIAESVHATCPASAEHVARVAASHPVVAARLQTDEARRRPTPKYARYDGAWSDLPSPEPAPVGAHECWDEPIFAALVEQLGLTTVLDAPDDVALAEHDSDAVDQPHHRHGTESSGPSSRESLCLGPRLWKTPIRPSERGRLARHGHFT